MNFDPVKVAFWTKHLQNWPLSGLSLTDYCRQQAIGYSTFYTWRKRLGSATVDTTVVDMSATASEPPIKVKVSKPKPLTSVASVSDKPSLKPLQLVPVSIAMTAKPPDIVLRSPAGWQVTIAGSVEFSDLAHLLRLIP